MGVISFLGKIVLVTVNIIIMLLSMAMIVCGILVVVGKDIYNDLLDRVKEPLQTATTSIGVQVDVSSLSLTDLMLPFAYAIIAAGVLMGALSLLGCIGACYTLKVVLIVYVIATLVLFLAQAIVVVLVYADKNAFDCSVKTRIKDTLQGYNDIEGTDIKTLAWNAIMNYEECCGVDGYKDFQELDYWPPKLIGNVSMKLETPIICCKVKSSNYSCAEEGTANPINNWYNMGCYDKLFNLIVDNAFVITVITCSLALQLLLIFFTIWILATKDNKIDVL